MSDYKAIWLRGINGSGMEVLIEIEKNKWVSVIQDYGGRISHIVEPAGIEAAIEGHRKATQQ